MKESMVRWARGFTWLTILEVRTLGLSFLAGPKAAQVCSMSRLRIVGTLLFLAGCVASSEAKTDSCHLSEPEDANVFVLQESTEITISSSSSGKCLLKGVRVLGDGGAWKHVDTLRRFIYSSLGQPVAHSHYQAWRDAVIGIASICSREPNREEECLALFEDMLSRDHWIKNVQIWNIADEGTRGKEYNIRIAQETSIIAFSFMSGRAPRDRLASFTKTSAFKGLHAHAQRLIVDLARQSEEGPRQ